MSEANRWRYTALRNAWVNDASGETVLVLDEDMPTELRPEKDDE